MRESVCTFFGAGERGLSLSLLLLAEFPGGVNRGAPSEYVFFRGCFELWVDKY